MNKFTTFLGTLLAAAFLIGLATTLTRSTMIGFFDGSTSKKPIIVDLVNVVARPIKNAAANNVPRNVVNLFILFITFLFKPISNT